MLEIHLRLNSDQCAFAMSEAPFPAIVGEHSSGKTEALLSRLIIKKLTDPSCDVGYYGFSNSYISNFLIPRIALMLESKGFSFKIDKLQKTIAIKSFGKFIFRSTEYLENLCGYQHADAVIDDIDVMNESHAKAILDKVISRNRQSKPSGTLNSVAVSAVNLYQNCKFSIYNADINLNKHNLPEGYVEALTHA